MTIKTKMNLADFRFWDGALETEKFLTWRDMEKIEEELLSDKEEWDATELNDLFWFDRDWIAVFLGYADWENLVYLREEKETYFDPEDI